MKKITIIAIAVTLLTACSKENTEMNPGTTGTAPNSEKVLQPRAFNATIHAVANTDPSIPQTPCTGDLQPFATPDFILSGSAIHMGQLQSSSLHHDACDLSFTTALLTTEVSGQIVAANGDVIYYSGDDVVNVANLLAPPPTGPIEGSITGVWTINGGTGRFLNATGTLYVDGIVNLVGGTFDCEIVGTITY